MQKNHIFKRLTSGLLALVMVIGLLPMGAVRVEAEDSETVTTTRGKWYRTSVTIPSGTSYVPVNSVDDLTTYNTGWDGVTEKPYPLVLCYKGNDGNWYALNVSGTDFSLQQITVTENVDENNEKTNEYTISGNSSSWHLLRSENGWQISNSQSSMDINRRFLNFNFWGGSVALYGYDWGCEWEIQQSATASAFNLSYTVSAGYDDKNQDGTDPHVYDTGDIISLGIDSSNALAVTKTYVANTATSTDAGTWADLYIFAPKTAEVGNYVAIEYVQDTYTVQEGDYENTAALLAMIREDLTILLSEDASVVKTEYALKDDHNDVTYLWTKKVTNQWGGTDYESCDTVSDEGEYRLSVIYKNSLELKQISVLVEPETTITLNPTAVTLTEGNSTTVTATVTGANVSDVVWTSGNETIATVDQTDTGATINGVNAGTTTITATVDGKSATVNVTVSEPVPSISLDQASMSLEIGGSTTLTASTANAPEGATIVWSCNPEGIVALATPTADLTESVTVTAQAAGTATITATLQSTSGTLSSATTSVSIIDPNAAPTIAMDSATVVAGQSQVITAVVPETITDNYTNVAYKWSVSEWNIISFSDSGITNTITGQKPGTITLTLKIEGTDKTTGTWSSIAETSVQISVIAPSINIEPSSVTMKPSSSTTLLWSVSDADGNVYKTSDYELWINTGVANCSIDYVNGMITVNSYSYETSGTITVQLAYSSNLLDTVSVPVTLTNATYTVDITKDNVSASDFSLDIDGTAALGVAVKTAAGEAVENPTVYWDSSNKDVAIVDASGNITAIAPGEATITATYEGVTDTVKVTVNEPEVSIDISDVTVNKNLTQAVAHTITVTVGGQTYAGATPTVEWSTGDNAYATVDSNGVVTGVAGGTTTVTAKVTKLTVNGVTFALTTQHSYTAEVTVTVDPVVGFDYSQMPESIVLDAKVEGEKEIAIPLKFFYEGIANPSQVTVTCQVVGLEDAGTTINALIDPETNILTITASGKCDGTFSVKITKVDGEEGIIIDSQSNTYEIAFTVNDNSAVTNGTLTLDADHLALVYEQTATAPGVLSLMHGTYAVKDYTLSYTTTSDAITVGADGTVTAHKTEVTDAEVTVIATYTYGGEQKTASTTFTVDVVEYTSPYSLDLGTDYPGIYVGTEFTVTPHVDLASKLDTLTPWTIRWVSSDPDVLSVTSGTYTYGGPLTADANGIQYIGDGEVTLKANAAGTAVLTAYLVAVDGQEEFGVFDSISVTVNDKKLELNAGVFYDDYVDPSTKAMDTAAMENTLYDISDLCAELLSTGNYELRIKDLHTFQPDSNGLDARVIAVVGDNHIDFSNVVLNIYDKTTEQLVLDKDTLLPVEIPAGMLTYYDVETANVGWVPIRVTFKDYYLEDYDNQDSGDDLYEYSEYPTGGNGQDGVVWMYVREAPVTTESTQVEFVDEDGVVQTANVTLKVDRYRPWLGAGVLNTTEHSANNSPLQNMEEYGSSIADQLLLQILFSYTYGEESYVLDANPVEENGAYAWYLEGNTLRHCASDKTEMNVWDRQDYMAYEVPGIEQTPAIGYLVVQWNKIKIGNSYRDLNEPVSVRIPIVIREDSVFINPKVTYGLQLDNAWGDINGYNYISVMGAGPDGGGYYISSYAITYNCDLPDYRYSVGIRPAAVGFFSGSKGTWHEEFRVDAPLGSSSVTPYLHSITRLNGTVIILDEGEREGGPDYTIEVDPQLLILRSEDSQLTSIPNTGTVKATIRDKDGKLITVDAKVKWTMRNSEYAVSSFVTSTGRDQSETEEVDASQNGVTSTHTITGQNVGVTYYTAQLIEIQEPDGYGGLVWTNVSKHNIADYVIIDVVNETHKGEMSVVVDYGKQIEIDISSFIKNEPTGYDFLGFSDMEHSLRKSALTHYGEIEIDSSNDVYYTMTELLDGVDPLYVIFQHIESDENGNQVYTWHHYLLNIVPATVMYYETDFADGIFTTEGDWSTVGTPVSENQDSYVSDNLNPVVTDGEEYHNEIYGYDSSYTDDGTLSNGSSLLALGEGVDKTTAQFTFTGTGFDIISRTNPKQATIRVDVFDADGNVERTKFVINKGNYELYQIPVISIEGLEHGTYTVVIGVYQGYAPGEGYTASATAGLTRGNEFYFDAVRIYKPVSDTVVLYEDYTVGDLYKEDGEYAPAITEVGQMLVGQDKLVDLSGTSLENSVLWFDDLEASNDVNPTYSQYGPNNEVYLAPGQGIAFKISSKAVPASIDIGVKTIMASGTTTYVVSNTGTYKFVEDQYVLHDQMTAEQKANCDGKRYTTLEDRGNTLYITDSDGEYARIPGGYVVAEDGDTGTKYAPVAGNAKVKATICDTYTDVATLEQQISSATAQYYSITDKQDLNELFEDGFAYVVIQNAGVGILSITDIKVAYNTNPVSAQAVTYSVDLDAVAVAKYFTASRPSAPTLSKAEDGNWYYYVNGVVDTSYNGLVGHSGNLWYVQNGQVIFTHNGMITFGGEQFYVKGGKVDTSVNSIQKRDGTWYYFTDGRVDTAMTGMIEKLGDLWYVNAGYVDFNKTGLVPHEGSLLYVRYGQHIANYVGLVKSEIGQWLYVNNGAVDYSYTGFAKRNGNWWYVVDGAVDFTFIGYVSDGNVKYFVEYGLVDASNPIYS